MKKQMGLTVLAAGLAVVGFAPTAAAQVGPNPGTVSIVHFTYGGGGCPSNSVGANITSDAKMLTVLYDKFIANGGGTGSDAHKECTLVVELAFPQGWSYSIVTADYRGFAHLNSGMTATQRSRYWFFGNSVAFQTKLKGPYHEDYYRRDEVGINATVWSPCGSIAPLHVKSSVDVDPPTSLGTMTVDSTDLRVAQIYGLQWRKCP
jgi:hypothetical protein